MLVKWSAKLNEYDYEYNNGQQQHNENYYKNKKHHGKWDWWREIETERYKAIYTKIKNLNLKMMLLCRR